MRASEKRDVLIVEGTIVESFRGDTHAVEIAIGGGKHRVLARRSGKLVMRHLKVLPGDHVSVELSPYDLTRGRIVERKRDAA